MNDTDFLKIIDATPLVSIDLVIKNERGEVLLGKRQNKPAQHCWFVPGGRIRKNETIATALNRIAGKELGLPLQQSDCQLLGVYEHIYDDNFLGEENINTHYVVLAFTSRIASDQQLFADEQHKCLKWWAIENALSHESVHQNTKNYFLSP
jgi:colanic acid biosynthesis protein WcaH